MTDKEQIIIDGVDVSECTFHYQNKEGEHKCFKGDVVAICDGDCSYGAIYLKEQLARKTQECEELEKTNKLLLVKAQDGISKRAWAYEQCKKRADRYRNALDEIAEHYEKVIKNLTTYDEVYDANISIEALHNISDIINKAKGKNNGNYS